MLRSFFEVSIVCLFTILIWFVLMGLVNTGIVKPQYGVVVLIINLVIILGVDLRLILKLITSRSQLIKSKKIIAYLIVILFLLFFSYISISFNFDMIRIYITGETGCPLCP